MPSKRTLLLIACVLIVGVLGIATGGGPQSVASQPQPATPFADAYPHTGRFIPVRVVRYFDRDIGDSLKWSVNDQCTQIIGGLRFGEVPYQIVVRNHIGEIVAMQDLEGSLQKAISGDWICESYFEIDVPDAPFYEVFLGIERVVGFKASDFPIRAIDAPRIVLDDL